MKRFFAWDIGPNGGVAVNGISPPCVTKEAAAEWARTRFPKTSARQIAIAEIIGIAEYANPPVVVNPVPPHIDFLKTDEPAKAVA
jgi:hypothetical protein